MTASTSLLNRLPAWHEGAYALRLVLAAVLALAAGAFLPGGHAFSAVISALLVVRPYQQGALKAGALRLLATLGGVMLAFVAVQLKAFGLNDYVRLLIALVPLSLMAAYNSSWRTALIAAVLIISAPAGEGEVRVAILRAGVVALGAIIGTLVSVIVLPQPHKHVVARRAVTILQLLAASLSGAADPATAKGEKAEAKLRRALLELGQMARDNGKGHRDDDESRQVVRLVRHVQALVVLLRANWRRAPETANAAFCAALSDALAMLKAGGTPELKPLYATLPEGGIDAWLLKSIANDVTALVRLCAAP